MNRFQKEFLDKLVKLCEEYNVVITEEGYVDSLEDWVDVKRSFKFVCKEDENGLKLIGVENI